MSSAAGTDIKALIGNATVLRTLRAQQFVDDSFGLPTVTDILAELEKPGRDPRPAFQTATFKEGVEELKDLRSGMVLEGVVTNVAAFGAFVDVGVHQDGLVHVSAMSKTFVSDPRDVVKSGDIVRVKVLDVDIPRKRISLTLRLDDEAAPKGAAPQGGNEQRGGRGERGARPERRANPPRQARGGGSSQPPRSRRHGRGPAAGLPGRQRPLSGTQSGVTVGARDPRAGPSRHSGLTS